MTKKKVTTKKKNIKSSNAKELKNIIQELNNKIDDHKEKNVKLLAEFDNYKKRINREKNDYEKYEGANIFKSIIPILDDIDRVFDLKIDIDQSIVDGINLIKNKFITVLNDFGISSYESINKEFDPDYHEAIMLKKSKKKTNIIIEEFQKGYTYHEKVIRHSKVVVSE